MLGLALCMNCMIRGHYIDLKRSQGLNAMGSGTGHISYQQVGEGSQQYDE